MKYTMQRTGENAAEMKTENGCCIRIIFDKEYNTEVENIITNNLLMSYEQRIRNNVS